MAAQLADRAASPAVQAAFARRCGYVHRDFSADNLLVLPDGYRIIDWQRPIYGPTELDQVDLLNSLGYDPACSVDGSVIQAWLILSIGWLTEAKARWFPQGDSYDRQVAELIARLCAPAERGREGRRL
jgi:aminoglycoside/choline kinase family phosphotransferase